MRVSCHATTIPNLVSHQFPSPESVLCSHNSISFFNIVIFPVRFPSHLLSCLFSTVSFCLLSSFSDNPRPTFLLASLLLSSLSASRSSSCPCRRRRRMIREQRRKTTSPHLLLSALCHFFRRYACQHGCRKVEQFSESLVCTQHEPAGLRQRSML